MNLIEVTGGRKKEREIVEEAVVWCIKKLMPKMRTLDIHVQIENLDVYGYCNMADTNRQFDLSIQKNLSLYDLISTVCHEMVHVKQYARKELRDANGFNTAWKSKTYSFDTAYHERPWEKEAFRLEETLALECFKAIAVTA